MLNLSLFQYLQGIKYGIWNDIPTGEGGGIGLNTRPWELVVVQFFNCLESRQALINGISLALHKQLETNEIIFSIALVE